MHTSTTLRDVCVKEKKAAEAAQREAEKKAAPAPAKAPEPVVPAYVPPPRPAPVPEPPVPAYVPPPVPAPEPVRLKEPEPEPEPEPQPAVEPAPENSTSLYFATGSYTYTSPEPEPTPVQQFGALRVEDVEPPQPEADTSLYANVEVARRSAAEEPAPAGVPTADSAEGSAQPTLFVAEAIYDYEATAEDELAFHAGDRINVIQKACVLDFWGLFSQLLLTM